MKIEMLKVKDLIPYENNPRLNDKAVQAVADSIREFGFKVPIVVDKNLVIITGHTRLKACLKLGIEEAPCIIAEDLSEDKVKAFRLADNKVGEIAEWDLEKLKVELGQIDFDMTEFGFSLDDDPNELIEDEPPEVDEENEPTAKIGDIWRLGEHLVGCGDCLNIDFLDQLMDGQLAECVVTDPPYNMAYEGAGNAKNRSAKKILNDNMSNEDFEKFLTGAYKSMAIAMEDGASFYVFYKELGQGVFITALKNAGLNFKQELIWVKNHLVLGGSKYQSMYEPCLFGCLGKKVKNWNAGRKETSVIESIDLMNEVELRTAIKELMESVKTDIIREDKPLKNDLHPTMKPVRLLGKFIRNSTKKGQIVLDLFGGSGSSLMACEQLNRVCRMMELDPKYVDVIIKRWETFTGKKAELIREQK